MANHPEPQINGLHKTQVDDVSISGFDTDSGAVLEDCEVSQNDESAAKHRKIVFESYRKLASRRVDLVGDYAGNELFLIEGDSLLLRCFQDDRLDFHQGLQLLHLTYNVEDFLHNLLRRKCNFNIVFFDCNKTLCASQTENRLSIDKYILARAAVIRHLQIALVQTQPRVHIQIYESWTSPAFLTDLKTSPPYFVMAHDGASTNGLQNKHREELNHKRVIGEQSVALRTMILFMAAQGFNVALINELQWRDTKVLTEVLESRMSKSVKLNCHSTITLEVSGPVLDLVPCLESLEAREADLTERQCLAVVTVVTILKNRPPKIVVDVWEDLCSKFLLHQALLETLPLSMRSISEIPTNASAQTFLASMCSTAVLILQDQTWQKHVSHKHDFSDIADFVDGRLFLYLCSQEIQQNQLDGATGSIWSKLVAEVKRLASSATFDGIMLNDEQLVPHDMPVPPPKSATIRSSTVLPFSNPVFDKHLKSVHIDIDTNIHNQSVGSEKVFSELSHWHNAKSLNPHKGSKPDPRSASFALRRNQRYMAEMQRYAASLTNAVGRSLEPEIIVPSQKIESISGQNPPSTKISSQKGQASIAKDQQRLKKPAKGKAAALNATKEAMLNRIALENTKKTDTAVQKMFKSWQEVLKDLDVGDAITRYAKAQTYLTNLRSEVRSIVGAEVELYIVNCLVLYWSEHCQKRTGSRQEHILAMIWNHVRQIASHDTLPKSTLKAVKTIVSTLSLPEVPEAAEAFVDRNIPFPLALPRMKSGLNINIASKDFQLLHCGPYLERSFNSVPDARVDFRPDDWQRKVLDGIDADQSVFVVAPTSAGKTFISFYAMRKVLQADDEGVLVYVAPTKALVNQIAAEIQARYSKTFKHGGKSVWAIHTRDHRVNNPTGCQVLVTVPHILQIMLLSPSNAKTWSNRVKRIIFDEIHAIGQAEDGVIWEQLLLMAPCPIIGLSATVGNPDDFSQWLQSTQAAIGKELVTVQHPYRYSDLRKYLHVFPEQFSFTGIPDPNLLSGLGLDESPGLNHIHPVAALVDKSRGIPEDLSLEPKDCYKLWQAMRKVESEAYPVAMELSPDCALPDVSRKVDILAWEQSLKVLLQDWLKDPTSPFDLLLHEIEQSFRNVNPQVEYVTRLDMAKTSTQQLITQGNGHITSILSLLCRLHERDALPAIVFNYDRSQCEDHAKAILSQLREAEGAQVKSGPRWEKKLARWEEWKEEKSKRDAKFAKASDKKKAKKSRGDQDDDDKISRADLQRDVASKDADKWEGFDPKAAAKGYTFADHSKAQDSEVQGYVKKLRYSDVQPWLIDALYRGIGVHHAGMPRAYRTCVEMLFRKRFLRVVIATGTLALGINMPCKTVVFSGDSVYLTALNYRQCAGRGGRRGFDLLGNVVFHGISKDKVCRLISSRLPDLNGHFPITTSLVLRLFSLLHGSGHSPYAVKAIDSLLSQPRLYMGGESFKDQTMHHLRFSIEYLRRQKLLAGNGEPLNFAGLVSHLYYTENSSFAFHALLKEGYFHELCAGIDEDEKGTLTTMMLTMSYLFQPVPCRRSDIEFKEKIVKPSSSIVFLPPLPRAATKILRDHNRETLQIYKTYVKTFVEQHIKDADNTLPLSGMRFGGPSSNSRIDGSNHLQEAHIRSSFVALSGHGDDFTSIHDLCATTRSGVFLEEAVIPYMPSTEELEVPLNAWLYDFFQHGDVHTIEKANGIRRSDIWFRLNDFSLVLATIVTSLSGFLKLGETVDLDMLDVRGSGDIHEEMQDDKSSEEQDRDKGVSASADNAANGTGARAPRGQAKSKKAKVADSWDDEEEAGDDAGRSGKKQEGDIERMTEGLHVSGVEVDGGLLNVLKAFRRLKEEFDFKFKAMWA